MMAPVEPGAGNFTKRRSRRRWFAELKAELLAAWVSRASEQRIESVMGSRLRAVLLWQIFRTIRQRAQPDERLQAVVEFRITGRPDHGADAYQLELAHGRCRRPRHKSPKPALTLELDGIAFLHLVGGMVSPQRLLIAGKLRPHGDLLLALALPTALRLPRRRPQGRSGSR
jgi:SCP-2 sterol transfer family